MTWDKDIPGKVGEQIPAYDSMATQVREKLADESQPLILARDEANFLRTAIEKALPIEDGKDTQ